MLKRSGKLISALVAVLAVNEGSAAEPKLYPAFDIDARIELLGVVNYLATGERPWLELARLPELEAFGFARYGRDIERRFARYKGNEAAKAFRAAMEGARDVADVAGHFLDLGAPPALARPALRGGPGMPVEDRVPDEKLEALRRAASAFAAESGFAAFSKAHEADYARWRTLLSERARETGPRHRAELERYTGLRVTADYRVLISPVLPQVGVNHIEPSRITSVWDPGEIVRDMPQFRESLWHENAHLLLNPLGDAQTDFLERTEPLYAAIGHYCNGGWPNCLNEHVVQAVSSRMQQWYDETGRSAGLPRDLDPAGRLAELERKLPYLAILIERLKEFESGRSRYPDIKAFYPRLLEALDAENKRLAKSPASPR